MAGTIPSRAFLDFVLRHALIQTNICTRQKHENGYILQPRAVPDYNLIFVTRGQAVWVIDDESFAMSPGDLVLVPPRVRHHAFSRTRKITLGSLHVEFTLPGGQDVFELLSPPRFRSIEPGSRLDSYLHGSLLEWDRNDKAQSLLMLPNWARLVVFELLHHDARLGLLRQRAIDPIVAALLDELDRRIGRSTSLRELAQLSGFSQQHLNRLFRRALGMTPLQYLSRLRMDRAKIMLADGRLNIRAIAAKLGFEDAYYFSRFFKQHFGCSPAQYRVAIGSDSPSPRSGSAFTADI